MSNPQGHVVATSVDGTHRQVIVEINSGAVCARCEAGKGCGAGLLGRAPGDRRVTASLAADIAVRNGDLVSISLAPRNVLSAAILVYGYPLSGAVLAAIFAYAIGLGDVAGASAALVGLGTGVMIARTRLNSDRCLHDFTPVVVDRLASAND